MVIYGDILFIVNMTVDYLLIGLTSLILKREIRTLRQIFAAVIGGISAFYIFLDIKYFFIDILYRAAVSAVMIFTAFGFIGFRKLLRAALVNLMLSLLLSGIADMLVTVFKTDSVTVNNTVLYIAFSPVLLISVSLGFYFVVKLIFRFKKNSLTNELCFVTVFLGENTAKFKALIDSGNSITDVLSDSEILIVSKNVIKEICSCDIDSFFEKDENKLRCRLIPTETVGGSAVLKAVRCDRAIISRRDICYELKRPIIALSKQNFKDEYDIIIPLGAVKGR